MARKRQSSPLEDLVDLTARLPWWSGVALAVVAFAVLHYLAAREMAAGLLAHTAAASYETFPEQGHGGMVRVSLERALQIAAEP